MIWLRKKLDSHQNSCNSHRLLERLILYLTIVLNHAKYWKYLKAVGKLVFVLLGIHAFIFHFGHYGVLIKISWIKFKLEVFIAKLWLTSYDAYRLSTEILPNIIESTLYLIFIYYCNANILKINMMHSEVNTLCYLHWIKTPKRVLI